MEYQTLFNQLRVVPGYTIHIVPRDEVVILYNRQRPLLLHGQDNVLLFQVLQNQHNLPESGSLGNLALRAVQLIEKKVLIIEPE